MFCNVTWFFGYHAGQVLGCLKEVKAQISKRCKTEVYKIMMDVSVCARGLTAQIFKATQCQAVQAHDRIEFVS